MIPLKDYNPTKNFPLLTITIIVLNVLAFIQDRMTGHYEQILVHTGRGVQQVTQFVGGLTANYALVPSTLAAHPWTSWYHIFTSMFLHGNWLHIGSNMLFFWIFGNNIEDVLGKSRFVIFYFSAGLAAGLAQVLSAPHSTVPMIGASGAVAGIMGAYLVLYPHARILTLLPIFFFFTFIEVPAYIMIGYWVLLQVISVNWLDASSALEGGVAYYAHIGGFAAGVALLFLFGGRKLRNQ